MARVSILECATLPVLLLAEPTVAAWSLPFRVSHDPATSRTETDGGRNVIAAGENVFVVWSDDRDGNAEIYFRERLAGSWQTETRLTTNPAASIHPAIGRPGVFDVRVVWEDDRTGHPEIWTKRKIEGFWGADSCLTCDAFESAHPSLDHRGEHLVWEETKEGTRRIYYRQRLADGTWQGEMPLSNAGAVPSHPTVASEHDSPFSVGQALVLAAWQDTRDGNSEIYARSFVPPAWEPEKRVSNDPHASTNPSAATEWNGCTDAIFPAFRLAWQDDAGGVDKILFVQANGQGSFWENPVPVSTSVGWARHPSLSTAFDFQLGPFGPGLCPYPALAWEEVGADSATNIVYLDVVRGEPMVVSAANSDGENASLAVSYELVSPGTLLRRLEVVWSDARDGNWEIYEAGEATVIDITGVGESRSAVASGIRVDASPNPFRESTRLSFQLDRLAQAALRVVDVAGRLVRQLEPSARAAGTHELIWDGRDDGGDPVAGGTYFAVLEVDGVRSHRRIVRLR